MTVLLDMPAAEYHANPALGSSDVRELLRSAAHFRERRDHGSESTEAMQLGTLVHECVLEPALWAKRVVAPRGDKRHKKVQEAWHAFCDTHKIKAGSAPWEDVDAAVSRGELTLMDAQQKALAEAMAASVRSHKLAAHLLNTSEVREGSYFWDDDGVPCKARVDMGVRRALIVDLKTTGDASEDGFPKSVVSHSYHVQASHYEAGYRAITGNRASFAWIAVEKTPPYAVAVYEADAEMLEIGHLLRERALRTYRECEASGVWPAYGEGHRVIRLPGWYSSKWKEEVA